MTENHIFSAGGMFADPVFDRDVAAFERAFSSAFGTSADTGLFGFSDPDLKDPESVSITEALLYLARQARDGRGRVVEVSFCAHTNLGGGR